MDDQHARAWATIDTGALRKNLAQVRALCPEAGIVPVIKANAYGHGMRAMAKVLAKTHTQVAGLAVATLAEALRLHDLDLHLPIIVLGGFATEAELSQCLELGLEPVVHSPHQLALLEQQFSEQIFGDKRKLWLKVNTGMNRLGFAPDAAFEAWRMLHKFPGVELMLMSHLAWADEPDNPDAVAFTGKQLAAFAALRERLAGAEKTDFACSLAASTGVLAHPESHYQFVRPGIMLYGASPLAGRSAEDLGLQPVMTLSARLIAINEVAAGARIGYGGTYTCERDSRVGVVAIGYGDGYPRSVPSGTPVLVKTAEGDTRTRLLGRVSMDTLAIDLTDLSAAAVGDEVVLWGAGLSADEIAQAAGTISYELFCQVTPRVPRVYV